MTRYVDTDNRDLEAQIVYLEARIDALMRKNAELAQHLAAKERDMSLWGHTNYPIDQLMKRS